MMKSLFVSVALFISFCACAETPSPIVGPVAGELIASGKLEVIEAKAIYYTGVSHLGTDCSVYVSAVSEIEDGELHVDYLVKNTLVVHGQEISDSASIAKRFKRRGEQYFPIDADERGSRPVLVEIQLTDEDAEPDYSQIKYYLENRLFHQFTRFDLNDQDFTDYSEALLLSIENENLSSDALDILDSARELEAKIVHVDHTDSGSCEELVLEEELKDITFTIGERHDHDH